MTAAFSAPAGAHFGLYAGGFLGPFGGAVIAVLIPQLRESFDASTAAVTAGITVYVVPFAVLQLVSGTIGERLGVTRTVRVGYAAYAVVTVAAALAPTIEAFLVCRALQGSANAFLTPLLLAALAGATAPGAVGRSVGTFAAVQTTALVASPLYGGLAGEVDWRLAFVLPAAAAVALACVPLPEPGERPAEPARLRDALVARVAWLGAGAFVGYFAIAGLSFLVALRAADAFGLGSTARGLLLAAFGATGALAGRPSGRLADRGRRRAIAAAGAALCTPAVVVLGLAGSVGVLGLAWAVAGVGSALLWAGLATLAVEAVPANRAGATSIFSACRFAGNAAAPLVWLPLYGVLSALPFLLAGALCAALAVATYARR